MQFREPGAPSWTSTQLHQSGAAGRASCENSATRQFYAFGVIDCVVLFHSWWRIVINDPPVSKTQLQSRAAERHRACEKTEKQVPTLHSMQSRWPVANGCQHSTSANTVLSLS